MVHLVVLMGCHRLDIIHHQVIVKHLLQLAAEVVDTVVVVLVREEEGGRWRKFLDHPQRQDPSADCSFKEMLADIVCMFNIHTFCCNLQTSLSHTNTHAHIESKREGDL